MAVKRILIIEDEMRIALALSRALEYRLSGKNEIDISPVGETAMNKLQSRFFDLVITDLRMPGMGGMEFIRHTRQISPQTRTMLITGYGSPEVEDVAGRLGAFYLPKPFSLHDFVEIVQKILAEEPLPAPVF